MIEHVGELIAVHASHPYITPCLYIHHLAEEFDGAFRILVEIGEQMMQQGHALIQVRCVQAEDILVSILIILNRVLINTVLVLAMDLRHMD